MQESWRRDVDKLTFIVCSIPHRVNETHRTSNHAFQKEIVSSGCMIGDVNLFLRLEDDESYQNDFVGDDDGQEPKQRLVGELEIMVAEKSQRRRGHGRGALLCFLRYILENESSIVAEFLSQGGFTKSLVNLKYSYLSVKIDESNYKSLALFESIGFLRVTETSNIFGELELRRDNPHVHWPRELLEKHSIYDYLEVAYDEGEWT